MFDRQFRKPVDSYSHVRPFKVPEGYRFVDRDDDNAEYFSGPNGELLIKWSNPDKEEYSSEDLFGPSCPPAPIRKRIPERCEFFNDGIYDDDNGELVIAPFGTSFYAPKIDDIPSLSPEEARINLMRELMIASVDTTYKVRELENRVEKLEKTVGTIIGHSYVL